MKMPWYTLYPCQREPAGQSSGWEETLPAGTIFGIHVSGPPEMVNEDSARVRTYGDLIEDYRWHPEAKFCGPDGKPCGRGTAGLLRRRSVEARAGSIRYIGKESNRLEDVRGGLVHDLDTVVTEYRDPDEWEMRILPALRRYPVAVLATESGVAKRTIHGVLSRRTPRTRTADALLRGLESLQVEGPPRDRNRLGLGSNSHDPLRGSH